MKKIEYLMFLFVFLGGFLIGYLGHGLTTKTVEETKYIKGDTVSGSVSMEQLSPIKEETPVIPLLPVKVIEDTETKTQKQIVDTAAIIAEYEKKRTYNAILFDDKKLGKLELYPTIQYNKLSGIDYNFTPIIQQKTIYKERIFQPFVSGSYSTLNYIGIGGGVFYHNLGLEYQYQKSLANQSNGHLFGLKYKF
ncbi:hypothetical protein JGH11_10920 [Dysgonomonas sp. Marseille-P4677]|uniref:hypothetical protein n=1 Tax=Dysgonomonas sp. Marseille-P4677 TaxID=2364790 RepID=UPI0019134451|nr:hypothetical protein [Dysgonomonas sp. Marseille-P4677]MBK5721385.1 hypothetical protein [Dysgonomonas sp. Marseille-P4677]